MSRGGKCLRLDVSDFHAVVHAEDVKSGEELAGESWWNHDVDGIVQATRLLPEVVVRALGVHFDQGVKSHLVFREDFEHLVANHTQRLELKF